MKSSVLLTFNALIACVLLLAVCADPSSGVDASSSTCETLTSGGKALTSSVVRDEFLIKFAKYYAKFERHRIIRESLLSANLSRFLIVDKSRIFDHYPSDFDVLKIEEELPVLAKALNHSSIQSVTYQHRLENFLNQACNDYDDENSDLDLDVKQESECQKAEARFDYSEPIQFKARQIFRALPTQIITQLNVRHMWNKGYTGQNVNVAVFDTGLEENHPHFKNVIERIDFTDDKDHKDPTDKIGHGTFVCGVIASSKECFGLAPDANLFVFKVFTDNQTSYTSWFLDAFNYAILKKIDIINLSIGGPDFNDMPFVNKVWEITSNKIVMVSGIGNDGPLYGTLNNPADQTDVIGVGGINSEDQIAKFSSRGMTTWELPFGYGRVKPDIVTYSTHVTGSKKKKGCRTLSGTSVASPIVAGAVALLMSAFKKKAMTSHINPASIKQALMSGADRLHNANMFEQGAGKLNIAQAYDILKRYKPQASAIPSYIDLTECPYFWPYCSQPLYYTGLPTIVNITIMNGMNQYGRIKKKPVWQPSLSNNGQYLELSFSYPTSLWPWSGYLAVSITVSEEAKDIDGLAEGFISFEVESPLPSSNQQQERTQSSLMNLYVKAKIIPTPLRKQRILWDQFHNLRYPSGYFPRDDLKMKNDPLDWNADHLHTNFKDTYQYLRNAGYFVEVLGTSLNCFDASNYGVLMIIDSEEEFDKSEIEKLYDDVTNKGLSVIVFAEWYNTSVIKVAKFFDENTRKWWTPVTGGANIPALNDLLEPYEIAFTDRIYEGTFKIGEHETYFGSGASIGKFPPSNKNYLVYKELKDQGEDFLADAANLSASARVQKTEQVPILGLAQINPNDKIPGTEELKAGRLVVYGDSSCLDSSHMEKDCYWLLSALIEYACYKNIYSPFKETNSKNFAKKNKQFVYPPRWNDKSFKKYSKVAVDAENRDMYLSCPKLIAEPPLPLKKLSPKFLPNKNNYYNSLILKPAGEESQEASQNQIEYESKSKDEPNASQTTSSITVTLLLNAGFPFLSTLSVLLLLCFFLFKFCKLKRLKRRRLVRCLFR